MQEASKMETPLSTRTSKSLENPLTEETNMEASGLPQLIIIILDVVSLPDPDITSICSKKLSLGARE